MMKTKNKGGRGQRNTIICRGTKTQMIADFSSETMQKTVDPTSLTKGQKKSSTWVSKPVKLALKNQGAIKTFSDVQINEFTSKRPAL